MYNLICIIGNIGVGKSTVANILKDNDYSELSFASPVKDIALILGFEYNDVYGSQEDKLKINKFWGVSGREFMQKFATNIMRNELNKHIDMNLDGKTIWVRICEKKIIELLNQNKKILVSDGRFPDEIDMIKKLGGKIVKIQRVNNIYKINHESESYIDKIDVDFVIDNDSTLSDLAINIKKILS